MKKVILMLVIGFLGKVSIQAQQLVLSPTAERTVAGFQYGSMLMFQTKKQWGLGGFYQQSLQTLGEGETKKTFYGIIVNAPIMRADRMNFFLHTRMGVVDRYFLVLVPGLETELKVSKRFTFSLDTSVRMSYPAAAMRVSFKI